MEIERLAVRYLTIALLIFTTSPLKAAFVFDRGELDNSRHPNVGWIAAFDKDGYRLGHYCSGTLIGEKIFLTASHCTIPIYDRRVDDPNYEGFQVYVGFTDDFINVGESINDLSDPSLVFLAESVHTNPDYDYYIMSPIPQHADIAVVILYHSPPITPALLPYENELDDLMAAKTISGFTFPAVGYGANDVIIPSGYSGGPWNWFDTGQFRYVGYSSYWALHPTYMILSMNYNIGDSGGCYGDSGGPIFLGDTGVVVAITVWGDIMCRAMSAPLRTDTIGARKFLSQFGVSLP